MVQVWRAFLHASLLGTEAEATRLREIKAEVFRQKQQQRAAARGEIGRVSACRIRHMFHGLQLRVGSSSTHLLQLSCPGFHHTRHMLHGLQHSWAAGLDICCRRVWPLKHMLLWALLRKLQYWLGSARSRAL